MRERRNGPAVNQVAGPLSSVCELTLASEEGRGSTFSLSLPAGLDVAEQPLLRRHNVVMPTTSRRSQTDQARFSGRVLVAEDVKTNQMLIELLLKRMGLEVIIVDDGNGAVQKAATESFDLIFMDIQMPNINGYDATRALREKGITTPIIALTAHAMKEDRRACLEAGCDGYLGKPIGRGELEHILRDYVTTELVSA